ncbi:MAG: hypothetical protein HY812_17500 [Planctomycetes bacterium]|nr:hypothetical protein [Planctomycetota bacterium]
MPQQKRCVFLSTDRLDGFVCDDELALEPLHSLGWAVESLPWRAANADWGRFDAVVIRSTWDYQHDPEAFLAALERVAASGALLLNPLDLVRWNLHKSYLRDLAAAGIPIVPTVFGRAPDGARLRALFDELSCDEIVLKPTISANAGGTLRLARGAPASAQESAAAAFAGREFMAQPFLQSVVEEGEFSAVFLGGEHSHSLVKRPRAGDFRVQEEHGGSIAPVHRHDVAVAAARVLRALPSTPLYARPDFARDASGDLLLMELELIEPALYFRIDPEAPVRFARALDARAAARRPTSR